MRRRQEGTQSLPGVPPPSKTSEADSIEEMVGALTDPIIVYPSGWEDTMPEWMKRDLPLHRLAHLMKCSQGKASWDEACDLEALIYMYPATLAHPLGEEWTRIYLHLGTRVMGDKFPQDIKEESLPDYYQEHLRDLKRWIQKKKVQARRERRHQEKAEKKTQVEPAKCEQIAFF